MSYDTTLGVCSAGFWTGIAASVVDAGLCRLTVRIDDALGSAVGR